MWNCIVYNYVKMDMVVIFSMDKNYYTHTYINSHIYYLNFNKSDDDKVPSRMTVIVFGLKPAPPGQSAS